MKSIYKVSFVILPIALFMASCGAEEEKVEEVVTLEPKVTLEEVIEGPFSHEIRVQGNVETEQDVMLTSEMGGLITALLVKEGQRVTKGQVIARVDASILASSRAELATQLKYAEYMLEKQEELRKRGVGSEFELETAKSQVNSIKASMNSVSTQQGKSVIRAPFTGVIDEVFASGGQMAGPASPIARLVNNSSVDIVATISEKHLLNVQLGTPIKVSFPNYKDTTMHLTVTNVGNYIEPTNRTFRIISSIKNNKLLLPNMLAEVRITDMHVDKGIVIASKAILKDENNKDFVFVAEPNKKKKGTYSVSIVFVKVVEKFDGKALIDGSTTLKKGQFIVVEGAKGIDKNTIVRDK